MFKSLQAARWSREVRILWNSVSCQKIKSVALKSPLTKKDSQVLSIAQSFPNLPPHHSRLPKKIVSNDGKSGITPRDLFTVPVVQSYIFPLFWRRKRAVKTFLSCIAYCNIHILVRVYSTVQYVCCKRVCMKESFAVAYLLLTRCLLPRLGLSKIGAQVLFAQEYYVSMQL